MLKINHFFISGSLILVLVILSAFLEEKKIKYTQNPTISYDGKAQTIVTAYKDTLNNDSLYLVRTEQNIPLNYFKKIITEVCFDNECRLLDITVFWNITGRYLGFELVNNEFLSKHDHEPFVASEYERLNELLADPTLPLGDTSFEKLIELPENEDDSVDGVSGATSVEVSKMVVKGAAYTTYTLWNIVHGSTKDLISNLTEKQLTPDLIHLILKSGDVSDKVWALNRIDQFTVLNSKLATSLLDIIASKDFFLSYSALNAIKTSHLNSDTLQDALFSIYPEADHSIKNMIVKKLMEAPYLNSEVVDSSRKLLINLNGQQLNSFLKLYTKFKVNDLQTCLSISEILQNDNRFIARQAYNFLRSSHVTDQRIQDRIIKYYPK
ncbi:hypothetical protein [Reichenbachiella sp. MALMAid0571]|uniref:hypothetical protein n=1 Tax=Reichenbachiella sp. MALMAid0571 TaxID=3143939 RepID=UPI0032DEEDC6